MKPIKNSWKGVALVSRWKKCSRHFFKMSRICRPAVAQNSFAPIPIIKGHHCIPNEAQCLKLFPKCIIRNEYEFAQGYEKMNVITIQTVNRFEYAITIHHILKQFWVVWMPMVVVRKWFFQWSENLRWLYAYGWIQPDKHQNSEVGMYVEEEHSSEIRINADPKFSRENVSW